MLIDTHTHLNFPPFDNDRDEVIRRSLEALESIVDVGADLESSQRSIQLAHDYSQIYAAVGIHPDEAQKIENLKHVISQLRKMAENLKVVAIGECGLDYHYPDIDKGKQKNLFTAQLKLAQELNLPIIIHCRSAQEEILQLIAKQSFDISELRSVIKSPPKGVFHCFAGNKEFLEKVLDLGFYVGFCGNITFKNAKDLQEVAKIAPIEKILLETDSPYLSPEPFRGLRNEPKNVRIICEFIATLKGLDPDKVAQITTENAKKLFNQTR